MLSILSIIFLLTLYSSSAELEEKTIPIVTSGMMRDNYPNNMHYIPNYFYVGRYIDPSRSVQSVALIAFNVEGFKVENLVNAKLVLVADLDDDITRASRAQELSLDVCYPATIWNEPAWDNRPSCEKTVNIAIADSGNYEIDITDVFKSLISSNYGLILKEHIAGETSTMKRFSTESYIKVGYGEIPPPSTGTQPPPAENSNLLEISSEQAYDGKSSLKITYCKGCPASPESREAHYAYLVTTKPALNPNTRYVASARIYIPSDWDGKSPIQITDDRSCNANTNAKYEYVTADMSRKDRWQLINMTFNTSEDTSKCYIRIGGNTLDISPTPGKYIYIDRVQIIEAPLESRQGAKTEDVNGDGKIDFNDLYYVGEQMASSDYNADVDSSNNVDIQDFSQVSRKLESAEKSNDVNKDGSVNVDDLYYVGEHMSSSDDDADINSDNNVDITDFLKVSEGLD